MQHAAGLYGFRPQDENASRRERARDFVLIDCSTMVARLLCSIAEANVVEVSWACRRLHLLLTELGAIPAAESVAAIELLASLSSPRRALEQCTGLLVELTQVVDGLPESMTRPSWRARRAPAHSSLRGVRSRSCSPAEHRRVSAGF